MKFTINRAALAEALGLIQGTIEKRVTIPILSHVRLQADNDTLNLTGTDTDMELRADIAAEIAEEGIITVPAHTLHDIVRKVESETITISCPQPYTKVTIKGGKSNFRLGTLPHEEFPTFTQGNDQTLSFTIAAEKLRRIIDRLKSCISTEETRYYLNGIYMHMPEGGNTLRSVATDGHRLAMIDETISTNNSDMPGIILPRKAAAEIRKLIDGLEGDINVFFSERIFSLSVAGKVFKTKLIDGTYPDYQRIIPKNLTESITFDADSLSNACDRALTVSDGKSAAVKLGLSAANINVSSTGSGEQSAQEDIEATGKISVAKDLGFNGGYVMDILRNFKGQTTIQFSEPSSPTIISNDDNAALTYVLMPMRV